MNLQITIYFYHMLHFKKNIFTNFNIKLKFNLKNLQMKYMKIELERWLILTSFKEYLEKMILIKKYSKIK